MYYVDLNISFIETSHAKYQRYSGTLYKSSVDEKNPTYINQLFDRIPPIYIIALVIASGQRARPINHSILIFSAYGNLHLISTCLNESKQFVDDLRAFFVVLCLSTNQPYNEVLEIERDAE